MKILPVILSGGFGTRLWPLSRQKMPKQFLNDLFGDNNLFNKALRLVSDKEIFLPPIAVTHQDHKFFALEEYNLLNLEIKNSIILEPCAKNTAIAIMSACLQALKLYNDDKLTLLILSSDHLIAPQDLFIKSVLNAAEITDKKIVTFTVKPIFAATGYGYIKRENKISDNCFAIKEFVEKPDLKKAEEFLKDDNYAWNAGIFCLNPNIYLEEAEKYLPQQLEVAKYSIGNAKEDGIFCEIDHNTYQTAQDISIDYGILEKSANIATTAMQANWSDVGDFNALHKENKKDENNNSKIGNVITYDTKNSLIHSHRNLITCLGLNNIIAVETDDALLIADKSRAQEIKNITKDLLAKNKTEVTTHNKGFRPWGHYETLAHDQGFRVKRILLKANSSISLQLHNHRSEHWVVIKGQALVQKNEETFILKTGESTFIPIKTKHRLTNNGNEILEIIEVQMGDYVEEDDIIRFEDDYGRS